MLLAELADQVAYAAKLTRVQARGRFVENHHVGFVHDGLGNAHPLTIALGEVAEQA